MSDDPQDFQLSDQTDDTSSEKAPADLPEQAQPAEAEAAPQESEAAPEAYATDLRESLVRQGEPAPEKARKGLLQRLAGRFNRTQNQPAPLSHAEEPPAAQVEASAPEELAAQNAPRFAESSSGSAGTAAAPEELEPEEYLSAEVLPEEESVEAEPAAEEAWPEDVFPGEAAGESAPGPETTDWMSDIRRETDDQASPADSAPVEEARGRESLRDFLATLMRSQDAKDKTEAPPEISDDLLAGRLGRSLGEAPEDHTPEEQVDAGLNGVEPFVFDQSKAPLFEVTSPYAAEALPEDVDLQGVFPEMEETPADEEASLLENQEARFSPADEVEADQPVEASDKAAFTGEPGAFTLSPEDQAQVWGETGQDMAQPAAPQPEDSQAAPGADEVPDLSRFSRDNSKGRPLSAEDGMAAAYLTGEEYAPPEDAAYSSDYLLQQALNRAYEEPSISNEDLRAIALEGYQDTLVSQPAATPEPAEVGLTDAPDLERDGGTAQAVAAPPPVEVQAPRRDFKTWFAARSVIEKILLIEALIVGLVVIAAIPFFVNAIVHANARPVSSGITPRPLPGNLPYPVGVTLPGGWYFPLAKSTFSGGKWQPVTSEWLEGSEVRRVLAVPWNPQTEAVVRSFHPGDVIHVLLSNQETADYKVVSVDRVPVTDTGVLTDQSPSLAIILYQEQATQRWVILGKP